jgi:hypothetical protein
VVPLGHRAKVPSLRQNPLAQSARLAKMLFNLGMPSDCALVVIDAGKKVTWCRSDLMAAGVKSGKQVAKARTNAL